MLLQRLMCFCCLWRKYFFSGGLAHYQMSTRHHYVPHTSKVVSRVSCFHREECINILTRGKQQTLNWNTTPHMSLPYAIHLSLVGSQYSQANQANIRLPDDALTPYFAMPSSRICITFMGSILWGKIGSFWCKIYICIYMLKSQYTEVT